MCGIAGIIDLKHQPIERLEHKLSAMGELLRHRGPDGRGVWQNTNNLIGFSHQRLSVIDLSDYGAQPMHAPNGTSIIFNGEIYNYKELRRDLSKTWTFKSSSDTETILAAYEKYGIDCVNHLRGMFAFGIWDEKNQRLFCARDHFGIKPFYYSEFGNTLAFASEMKALLPLLPSIETDPDAFSEYLTYQYTLGEQTLFSGIKQLLPGYGMLIEKGLVKTFKYWDIEYQVDYDHTEKYFHEKLLDLIDDSISVHLRSDVPIGSYLSGGIDSSLISILANRENEKNNQFFHGKFTQFPGYDESEYAELVSKQTGGTLHQIDINAQDFQDNIEKVIYHLDTPIAGPGSFPQFMVSKIASEHVKVVLGGQGGDEIFGGYARYVIAYFEQAIKASIDGTHKNGNFVVTPESIIPNLGVLREYKPLIKEFWREGLFGELDERYFRLINRSSDITNEVILPQLNPETVFSKFQKIFNSTSNVRKEAYFDSMTHFDFKCLLPALLHVEDRMSMAHGIESRVPLLDKRLVEFAATIPANVKFKNGNLKYLIKSCFANTLPKKLVERRGKMGFPVPLKEWFSDELHDMVQDIFHSSKAKNREFINHEAVLKNFTKGGKFSRKTWGLLSLELWHQQFHDKATDYQSLINRKN